MVKKRWCVKRWNLRVGLERWLLCFLLMLGLAWNPLAFADSGVLQIHPGTGWAPTFGGSSLSVVTTNPQDGDTGVGLYSDLRVRFNGAIQAGPGFGSIEVRDASGTLVPTTNTLDAANGFLFLEPAAPLEGQTTHAVSLPQNAILDLGGSGLQQAFSFIFTTFTPDGPNLRIAAYPFLLMEGSPTTVHIWTDQIADVARTIAVSSNPANELNHPSQVTLPAGAIGDEFTFSSDENFLTGPDRPVDLMAELTGEGVQSSVTLQIKDDDPDLGDHLRLAATSIRNDDDGDGIFEADEIAELFIEVQNVGGPFQVNVEVEVDVVDTGNLVTLGSGRCIMGGLSTGEIDGCDVRLLADDDLPADRYTVKLTITSNTDETIDYAFVDVASDFLPDFQITTNGLRNWTVDPHREFTRSFTALHRQDGFSLDLPVVEVFIEDASGARKILYETYADVRGAGFNEEVLDVQLVAPAIPGVYVIGAEINPGGQLTEHDVNNNLSETLTLTVRDPAEPIIDVAPLSLDFTNAALRVVGSGSTSSEPARVLYRKRSSWSRVFSAVEHAVDGIEIEVEGAALESLPDRLTLELLDGTRLELARSRGAGFGPGQVLWLGQSGNQRVVLRLDSGALDGEIELGEDRYRIVPLPDGGHGLAKLDPSRLHGSGEPERASVLGLVDQTFTLSNTGTGDLSVTSIALETAAPWISWLPQAPFTLAPGADQIVTVTVDFATAPLGMSTGRLLVESNDEDASPFPGGVFVNIDNTVPIGARDRVGVYRPADRVFQTDNDGSGTWTPPADQLCQLGVVGDVPLTGDWDGDGNDELGVYRPSSRQFLLDRNGDCAWSFGPGEDVACVFLEADGVPIVGDWNADGDDNIGLYRDRLFFMDVDESCSWTPATDQVSLFGLAGDEPIIGDWNQDGDDDIGIYRPSNRVYLMDLDESGTWTPATDRGCLFGLIGDQPIIGDWNGDGDDNLGVYRPGSRLFLMDRDENCQWSIIIDLWAIFGLAGDEPITGKW